mmetsp:Transcript_8902/g.29467  ORF Transcript_8902/g.29467 Transcript_8902/m.29467 type:complete len:287 (+) Transcript_8902:650-1510(+)
MRLHHRALAWVAAHRHHLLLPGHLDPARPSADRGGRLRLRLDTRAVPRGPAAQPVYPLGGFGPGLFPFLHSGLPGAYPGRGGCRLRNLRRRNPSGVHDHPRHPKHSLHSRDRQHHRPHFPAVGGFPAAPTRCRRDEGRRHHGAVARAAASDQLRGHDEWRASHRRRVPHDNLPRRRPFGRRGAVQRPVRCRHDVFSHHHVHYSSGWIYLGEAGPTLRRCVPQHLHSFAGAVCAAAAAALLLQSARAGRRHCACGHALLDPSGDHVRVAADPDLVFAAHLWLVRRCW